MTNKKETKNVVEETEKAVETTGNDYILELTKIARARCELIEDQFSRQNYAWSQCNSTYYLQNKAKKDLADKRASLNSAIAEQEDDNEDGIKVDNISNDAKENAVGYAIANAYEMIYQHNADLTIYKEFSGKTWTPPAKNPTNGVKRPTSRHFNGQDMKKLADQLLHGVLQH